MKLGIAQIKTTPGAFPAVMDRMVECSRQAAGQDVDLLVFPYVCLTGPGLIPFHDEEGLLLDLSAALIRLSQELLCPALVPVTVTVDGSSVDEVMLLQEGEIRPIKLLAGFASAIAKPSSRPHLRDAAEEAPGSRDQGAGNAPVDDGPAMDLPILEMGDMTLGVALSLDDVDDLVDFDFGVDAVIHISRIPFTAANPIPLVGESLFESRFVDDALDSGAWIVGVGSVCGFGMQAYSGGSFVLSPKGELVASAPMFTEALLVCELGKGAPATVDHPLAPEYCEPSVAIWEALSMALSGHCSSCGFHDVALGVDGSLNSLLLAVLATDALGPTHVHAVVRTDVEKDALEDARTVVRNLRIGSREVGENVLSPSALRGLEASDQIFSAVVAGVAREVDGIALGPWDKTSLAFGGARHDSSAALLPFGDIYRSDILSLARMRMTISPVIPRSALSRFDVPAVAKTFVPGDTPEALTLFVDRVLDAHIEGGSCVSDLVESFGGSEDVCAIVDAYDEAAPARLVGRPLLIMSEKTLAEDVGIAGFGWRDHVRDRDDLLSDDMPLGIYGGFLESLWDHGSGRDRLEHDISEIMGIVSDMALGAGVGSIGEVFGRGIDGGEWDEQGATPESLFGQSWESPFSEN